VSETLVFQGFWHFYLREGTRRAEMLAFPFAATRERVKLAKRVLSRFEQNDNVVRM